MIYLLAEETPNPDLFSICPNNPK